VSARFLPILAAGIIAALLALASTYREYGALADTLIQWLGAVAAILAIFEYFRTPRHK